MPIVLKINLRRSVLVIKDLIYPSYRSQTSLVAQKVIILKKRKQVIFFLLYIGQCELLINYRTIKYCTFTESTFS